MKLEMSIYDRWLYAAIPDLMAKFSHGTRIHNITQLMSCVQRPQLEINSEALGSQHPEFCIFESTIGPVNRADQLTKCYGGYNRATYCQLNLTRKIIPGEVHPCQMPCWMRTSMQCWGAFWLQSSTAFPSTYSTCSVSRFQNISLNQTDRRGSTKGTEFVGYRDFVFPIFHRVCSMWSTHERRSFFYIRNIGWRREHEDEIRLFIQG